MDENRKKALSAALGQIEKQFGKGSVMRLGDSTASRDIEAVSTGSLGLDIALGIGGLPKGRVVEIYGPESSGKTTLTLHAIAECQKGGGTAAFVDAEHALDPNYARNLGVKVNELLISQPDTGEQALEITDMLVRSGAVDRNPCRKGVPVAPRRHDSSLTRNFRSISWPMREWFYHPFAAWCSRTLSKPEALRRHLGATAGTQVHLQARGIADDQVEAGCPGHGIR